MLYDYCKGLTKKQILNVLKEYDTVKPLKTNDVSDVQKECEEYGLDYISNKYGVRLKDLKQYPHFRFRKRDSKGNKRRPTGYNPKPTEPVIDIFKEE